MALKYLDMLCEPNCKYIFFSMHKTIRNKSLSKTDHITLSLTSKHFCWDHQSCKLVPSLLTDFLRRLQKKQADNIFTLKAEEYWEYMQL